MRKISAYIFSAAVILTGILVSCKKDDETTTYLTMTGKIDFELPAYSVVGQEFNLIASGIITPSGATYYWASRSLDISDNDTVIGNKVSFVIPDRLGQDTLVAYAKYDGYYTASTTKYTEVFDPEIGGESIEGLVLGDYLFTDERDGSVYPVVKYGHLDWFTLNLYYAGPDGNLGSAYEHSDATDVVFGRLYSWVEATGGVTGSGLGGGPQGACPDGWSVPTEEDWADFANAVKPASVTDSLAFDDAWSGLAPDVSAPILINSKKMWEYSPDNIQTNLHRWNAIPTGKSGNAHTSFEQMLSYSFWWVSNLSPDGKRAFFRYIYWEYPDIPYAAADRENIGFSVRCVKLSN